jgi:chemotaxis-related protein WspD
MSHDTAGLSRHVVAPMDDCWRHIGVSGDRSCPELATFIHCRNCPVLTSAARRFFDRPAPAGYLDSWREILEQPAVARDADARSVLVFRLGNEWLALPTAVLAEVTSPRQLHRVPHRSGAELAGIVNIRGQLQVCILLEGLLGLPAPAVDIPVAASTARLIVVERVGDRGVERWVFRVDEVAGVHRVPGQSLRDVPATVSGAGTRATTALFSWHDRTVGLLDVSRLLDGLHGRISG